MSVGSHPFYFTGYTSASHLSGFFPAVAAGATLAFDLRPVAALSLCDRCVDIRSRVGGKGSTELVVKAVHREVSKEFIAELKDILQNNLTLDFEERFFHGKPQSSFHCTVNVPDIIVFPRKCTGEYGVGAGKKKVWLMKTI